MKTYFKSDLSTIIEECQDYIDQLDSKEEQQIYQEELNSVVSDFSRIVESGIFHDAIGKVVNKTNISVDVITEY